MENIGERQEYEFIDLTEETLSEQTQERPHGRYQYKRVARNGSLECTHRARSVYKFGDDDLKLGTCIELREPFGKWEIRFVEIKSIWVSRADGSVIIRGLPYARTRSLRGMLDQKKNEVCQILEIDDDDDRPDEAQGLFETDTQQILRVRILYKTNALYPAFRYGGERCWRKKTDLERENQAPLTCRWKFRMEYPNSYRRRTNKPSDRALFRVRQAEANPQFRGCDKEIKFHWLGHNIRGGSYRPEGGSQQWTAGDMYSGGGGVSQGAVGAGFKLVFGADNCPVACDTWALNFPDARMYRKDIPDLIRNHGIDLSCPIDILHLSPPCQPWCKLANIHPRREDDPRMDLLLGCPDVLDAVRNRLFTLEQTDGLLAAAHEQYFNTLIRGFTSLGFSIRWKPAPLIQYGLPQDRQRLLMLGACPGEELPPWAPATHSASPTRGQKPYLTEAKAIRGLDERRDPLHNVANTLPRNEPPRDGNEPFKRTILCSGAQGVNHFSGLRTFTERELACLQGFPRSHQFLGTKTEIRRQIGNAFPSCAVKALYEYLRKWLERVDGVQRAPAQVNAPAPQVVRPLLPAVDRRRRGVPAPALPVEPRHHVNGDLDEDEALQLALQESMNGHHLRTSRDVVEISDDEEEQHSPMSAVAPLLERMSIAPPDARAGHGADAESPLESRSRSVTLDFSPNPSPGPGGARKRSLDSMHDGEADEVMKEESPPKRERAVRAEDRDATAVDDGAISSGLPQYAGPRVARGAGDEGVAVGRSRSGGHCVRERESGSMPGGRDSHRGAPVDNITPRESTIDWSGIISQARQAGNSGNKVWTF